MDMEEIDRLEKLIEEKIFYIKRYQETLNKIKSIMRGPTPYREAYIQIMNLCNEALKD